MAKNRYFQAQLGARIVFRSSATRVYLSVSSTRGGGLTFSSKTGGEAVCTEISAARFLELRQEASAREKARNPKITASGLASPRHSWVLAG